MAVWMPVIVVPTSLATVAIAVFITVVSSAMTNCPEASVASTRVEAFARASPLAAVAVTAPRSRPAGRGASSGSGDDHGGHAPPRARLPHRRDDRRPRPRRERASAARRAVLPAVPAVVLDQP